MPTYRYRCEFCGDFERWESISSEPMTEHVCGAPCVRVFSVPRISVAATPNKAQEARSIVDREKRWDQDMPAYHRLRQNGLQPKGIDGCSELETRAETKTEIERGSISTLNRLIDKEVG